MCPSSCGKGYTLRAPAELCFRSDESKQKGVIAQTMKAAVISIPFIHITHKMK